MRVPHGPSGGDRMEPPQSGLLQQGIAGVARFLFGLREPVDRLTYAMVGFGLALLKYVIDATAIRLVSGASWTVLDYLSPFMDTRERAIGSEHDLLFYGMIAWSLPFMWIGMAMTIRRAYDAGLEASTGLLFFVPFVNYCLMLLL